jgi:hypothetical protein
VRRERTVADGGRRLQFTTQTTLDSERRAMRVRERYAAIVGGVAVERSCVFAMRCFTADELRILAEAAGFARVEVLSGAAAGAAADRLMLVAVR